MHIMSLRLIRSSVAGCSPLPGAPYGDDPPAHRRTPELNARRDARPVIHRVPTGSADVVDDDPCSITLTIALTAKRNLGPTHTAVPEHLLTAPQ